jgi:hypothetical protein
MTSGLDPVGFDGAGNLGHGFSLASQKRSGNGFNLANSGSLDSSLSLTNKANGHEPIGFDAGSLGNGFSLANKGLVRSFAPGHNQQHPFQRHPIAGDNPNSGENYFQPQAPFPSGATMGLQVTGHSVTGLHVNDSRKYSYPSPYFSPSPLTNNCFTSPSLITNSSIKMTGNAASGPYNTVSPSQPWLHPA